MNFYITAKSAELQGAPSFNLCHMTLTESLALYTPGHLASQSVFQQENIPVYQHIRSRSACLMALPLAWSLCAVAAPTSSSKPITQGGQTGFVVAREGRTSSTIVLPDKSLPVEVYAAEELAKHLQLSTGAKLPIVREGQLKVSAQSPIYIGNVQALRQIRVAPKAAAWGEWKTIPDASVTTAAPDTSGIVKLPDGGEMRTAANGTPTDDAIVLNIDLGQAQDVGALAVVNRPDAATNYNIRRIKVESSAKDDRQTWDETLFEGELTPSVNEANAIRFVPLKAVKRRYLRVSVLSNFWGTASTKDAANNQQLTWKEWRFAAPNPVAAVPANFQRLDTLGPNSFLVRTNGNALFLAGHDDEGDPMRDDVSAGTLFAVYEWLERQIGVHWLWPGELGTHIPKQNTLRVGSWNLRSKPPFVHTRMRPVVGRENWIPGKGGYTPEQRAKVVQEERVWYRRNRFARGVSLEYAHAYEDYWERFSKTHPEYFNLLPDGTRRPDPNYNGGQGYTISTAWANADFHDQVIADWKSRRSAKLPWINGAENDTNNLDLSPEALAWDVRDPAVGENWNNRVELAREAFLKNDPAWFTRLGSLSDRYARFLLTLQEKGKQTDPNVKVLGYGYANYSLPPINTKVNRDVVIGIVPNYMWPLSEKTHEMFKQQWIGWSKVGASLYLRPNYTLSGNNLPIFYAHQAGRDFQLAAQNNMIATDFDSLTSMWGTQGPTLYTLARLHWRPEMPLETVLDEYYSAFGPAKEAIRQYFTYWQKRTDEQAAHINKGELASLAPTQGGGQLFSNWQEIHRVAGVIFPPEDYAKTGQFLDAAAKAAKSDLMALRRIGFLRAGWNDARLTAAASLLAPGMKNSNPTAFASTLRELDQHRVMLGRDFPQAINIDLETWCESRHWGATRTLGDTVANAEILQHLLLDWEMRWDEKGVGEQQKWYTDFKPGREWQPVRIDSAWEGQAAGQKWKREHGKDYDGVAWYRYKFNLDEATKGQRMSLLFGAVDESATIYLNGQKIGDHPFIKPDDWQTPFEIEITNVARYGAENELSVKVEDKVGAGGVWQPVWIIKARP